MDLHRYPEGLAVEEWQHEDVECAPRVVSRGAGGEAGRSDRVYGNESGRGCGRIETLRIVREVGEVSEAVHFARDQLRVVGAHLIRAVLGVRTGSTGAEQRE